MLTYKLVLSTVKNPVDCFMDLVKHFPCIFESKYYTGPVTTQTSEIRSSFVTDITSCC